MWQSRTFYKGMRERWPWCWWWRFARQFWREWRRPEYAVHRMHFDIDLKVRRMVRRYGERGAYQAMARGHNAVLRRSMVELEALRRELTVKARARVSP